MENESPDTQLMLRIAALEKELSDHRQESDKVLAAAHEDLDPCYASLKLWMGENERLEKELAEATRIGLLSEERNHVMAIDMDKMNAKNERLRAVVEAAMEFQRGASQLRLFAALDALDRKEGKDG